MIRILLAMLFTLSSITPAIAQSDTMSNSQYSIMSDRQGEVGWCNPKAVPPTVVIKEVPVPGPERIITKEVIKTVMIPAAAAPAAPAKPSWIIYFDFDKNTPQAKCKEKLDQIAAYLKANPSARVVVIGNADIRTKVGHAYNERLSSRRANAVVAELTTRGISSQQAVATISWAGDRSPSVKKPDQTVCPQLQPGKTSDPQTKGCQEDRRVTVVVQ